MWSGKGASKGLLPGRDFLGPLFLIASTPPAAVVIWYLCCVLKGDHWELVAQFRAEGLGLLVRVWPAITWDAVRPVLAFMALELAFMRLIPGKRFEGPVTPMGNVPVYRANGVESYLATGLWWYLGAYYFKWFSPGIVYDEFGGMLSFMNAFSLLFCLFLYFKGLYFPSSSDSGSTGTNWLMDYYWGTELYPRILGWDVKTFTNCRFGLMGWAIILLSYCGKQYELYGTVSDSILVSTALQLVYIYKFFLWETGYWRSLDIMHDRAGYYICWGCLVWVPVTYTCHTLYMVEHPVVLGTPLAAGIFAAGLTMIYINYAADAERARVRATDGNTRVDFGQKAEIVRATYVTEKGEKKESVLLLNGWWGISRHFHYVPEILASFFWSVPALFNHAIPYFYTTFLTLLLTDRATRDDLRCSNKYGQYWAKYQKRVPYMIVPGIY